MLEKEESHTARAVEYKEWGQQSHSFWPEISELTKQREQDHCYGGDLISSIPPLRTFSIYIFPLLQNI
jgi:hypothetical protein